MTENKKLERQYEALYWKYLDLQKENKSLKDKLRRMKANASRK